VLRPRLAFARPTRLAFVLSRVEGTTSIRDLLDVAHLPEHELMHALYVLNRRGHLRID